MAAQVAVESDDGSSSHLFQQMEHYNWAEDAEFQSGLSSILASTEDSDQIDETTLRAKCFFFSR